MFLLLKAIAIIHMSLAANLTRADLLKGSPVPEKRDFALSKTVKPCEDFHKYVCSEVENHFKLPSDRNRWNFSFTDISERLLHAKKQFFKNIKSYQPPTAREEQFKNTYLACMDTKANAKEEKQFIKDEMARLKAIKSTPELMELSKSRMGEGYFSFSGVGAIPNKENPLRYDGLISSGSKSLPERSYYEKKEVTGDFKKILVDFFKTVGADKPQQRADWVLAFETDYANKTPLPREMRGRIAEKRDISRKDLLAKYPNLQMAKYLERVPAKANFVDLVPEANAFVNDAITNAPFDQLMSYYMWHSMNNYLDRAYPAFFKKYFEFRHKHLGGPAKRPPLQEECTELASGMFNQEFDRGMMDILFPNFPQDKVISLGESIRKSIIQGLEDNKWLSSSTKKEAIKKIKVARLFLVKPQKEADWDFMPVQKYSTDKMYANAALYSRTAEDKQFKEMSEDRNPDQWGMGPLTVNAYYSGFDNKFVLPMGILQYPFFDDKSLDIENLAAIGSVVGHELGHGIDDQGSKFDFSGKVRQWFAEKDLKEFQNRGAAFVEQFNKIGHDGKLTLGENIGDHVGIRFSYNAAFPDPAKVSVEDKKKFFESYARNWCMVATPATVQRLLKTDPHANAWERINQQVVHMDGFYEAYNCKEGDKMYRASADRIKVW
jgi:putative endopeptidase